jgi:hypothetical protein
MRARTRLLLILPLTLLPFVGGSDPAIAGAPGHWTKISTGTVSLINEPGLYRTPDGVLHVVFKRTVSGNDEIAHAAVAANGSTVGGVTTIVSGWGSLFDDPKLVAGPSSQLRMIFSGVSGPSAFFNHSVMYESFGNSAGTSWALQTYSLSQSTGAYASYGTGATTLSDATPVVTWTESPSTSVYYHVGESASAPASTPDGTLPVGACCSYYSTAARDGTDVFAAWYSNGGTNGTEGTFVQRIYPTEGTKMKVPYSSQGSASLDPGQAVAMASRVGGGTYVAFCRGYPTCGSMSLWKVGSSTVRKIPKTSGADSVAISRGPQGRLWIAWENNSTVKAYAVRTNKAATKFGAVQTLGRPAGTSSIYKIAIEGTAAKADVVINTGNGLFHQQVLPGLKLSASPTKWDGD